jgi:DNA-directed RNA polymerase specialized sigma24 family protein
MWTAQRKAALAIAAEWSIPGMAADDVRQEALLALWVATAKHDVERGPWPPFGRLAVKAHLRDLLQAATRQKRTAVVLELDPERDPSPVQLDLLAEQRDRLRDGIADAERLTATRGRWRENKRRQRAAA